MPVTTFYLDRAPVSAARYAAYVEATGYSPTETTNYLRGWTNGVPPPGIAAPRSVPVTGVSLSEARAFCAWAGGRLP